jgi:hypothetical protein
MLCSLADQTKIPHLTSIDHARLRHRYYSIRAFASASIAARYSFASLRRNSANRKQLAIPERLVNPSGEIAKWLFEGKVDHYQRQSRIIAIPQARCWKIR